MNNSEGNIRNRSFDDIWEDENSFAYNRKPKLEDLKGFCSTCVHKESCKGGCSLNMKNRDGDVYCLYKIENKGFSD